jgi:hypothetical protein
MSPIGTSPAYHGPLSPPDPELETAEVVRQLLAPLNEEQQFILDTTANAFFENGKRWPTYQYVEAILDRDRRDARSVLATFPVAGTSMTYASFRCTPWTGSLNDSTQVDLTLLGLHHYNGRFKAEAETLVRDGLRLLQVFIDARRAFVPPPTEVKHLQLTSDEVLARLRPDAPHELPTAAVLAGLVETEPPLAACLGGSGNNGNTWTWTVSRGSLLEFDGIGLDFDEYVRRFVVKYHVLRRVEQRVVVSPVSLPAALGYLDAVWRVMEGRDSHLVALPSPERAASLAFDAGTRAEYLERVGALGDVLKWLKVPAGGNQKGGHPLERLRAYLASKLPAESHERINGAVDQLVDVTDIRNGGLHAEAEPAALRAYYALGIQFPITDPGAAWQAVRAATVSAVDAIREEVQSYVDSNTVDATR